MLGKVSGSMKNAKYEKGQVIKSMDEVAQCYRYKQWIYLHDKPKHPSWIYNMTFATVDILLKAKRLHFAINQKGGI